MSLRPEVTGAKRAVVKVGSSSLTDAKGAAPSYIDMMRHNVTTITAALAG